MNFHPATCILHEGHYYDVSDSHCEPIALTSAYTFKSAAEAAGRFSGAINGNVYSRFTNPAVQAFKRRIAVLDGAEDSVAFSSGMAAIAAITHAWLSVGQNIVCLNEIFGTTLSAFSHYFGKPGIDVRVVKPDHLDEWYEAIDEKTSFVFFETPSNPTQQVVDISTISALAHAQGALVIVDNTFMTSLNQKPLKLGSYFVMQSTGKYIDGQGRCIAGIVSGKEKLMYDLRSVLRTPGFSLGPMDAWLMLKSVETLPPRVKAAGGSAERLASWLVSHRLSGNVFHTSLPDHPQRELIHRQQPRAHQSCVPLRAAAAP